MRLRTPTLNWTAIYLTIFLSFAFVFVSFFALGLSWNLTPSLPLGLWYSVGAFDINDNPRGKVVSICPPDTEYFRKARSDGILKWGMRCPGGFAPLLKRVVGVPGDLVEVNDRVLINGKEIAGGKLMTGVAKLHRGGEGFATKIGAGEIWIMGDSENSFDSRYFGSITLQNGAVVEKTSSISHFLSLSPVNYLAKSSCFSDIKKTQLAILFGLNIFN